MEEVIGKHRSYFITSSRIQSTYDGGSAMSKRNPNGYGSITHLSGNRSRPWMIRATMYDAKGHAYQKPVGYAETEAEAKILLAQYNRSPWNIDREKVTLSVLFQKWKEIKAPKMTLRSTQAMCSAYTHCSKYYGMKYRAMRAYHMQDCIDNCGHGYATQGSIKTMFYHLDRFAYELDIIEKMYSQIITAEQIPETTRKPFTQKQIDLLWKNIRKPDVDIVLIFLYTGLRNNELVKMRVKQVNRKENYLTGGSKTAAGKDRVIPIHPRIRPLVNARMKGKDPEDFLIGGHAALSQRTFMKKWNCVMQLIGAEHTPHEARHTFETFLDNAGANRKCIDMLMGHRSKDVGNRVYNHKTIDQLRETILLLK